ncbi:hypothetical protein AB7M47_000682 [Bradyrhizobium elkanii]|jgi:hypothetical protein
MHFEPKLGLVFRSGKYLDLRFRFGAYPKPIAPSIDKQYGLRVSYWADQLSRAFGPT